MAVDWFFELGELKRIARSGWWSAKVRHPETVAEHAFRAACIAYALALEEKQDGEKACVAALFHDAAEARTLDVHKVAKKYVVVDAEAAWRDQLQNAPKKTRDALGKRVPAEIQVVVKDADVLELAATAKEYVAAGYGEAQTWFDLAGPKLKTKTAKSWYAELRRAKPSDWYKKFRR
ncbi:HD domain-containing protein [Candidatus Micrarchaeota archaeon]|nr:HD domain-containing protein [Candidatus Micrarchaeota archaeon]